MSNTELVGWYAYAWASEPFIVAAVGTYVPLILEQFARQNAVWLEDLNTPCLKVPSHSPPFPGEGPTPIHKCVVYFLGRYIDTSSLPLYTFSLSVLVQALVVISMSGAADRGRFRKLLLLVFSLIGSLSVCIFLFVSPKHYYVASLLAVVSNSAYGAVSVCGNAFLPILVNARFEEESNASDSDEDQSTAHYHQDEEDQEHQDLEFSASEGDTLSDEDNPLTGLLGRTKNDSNNSPTIAKSRLAARVSGTGFAVGYLAAFFMQIVTIFVVIKTGSLQIAVFLVGLWWLIFQIPVKIFLRSRPGPPLPEKYHGKWYGYVMYGWATLIATFKEARQMRDVVTFLIGWFLISDGATTINATAVLFAQKELAMKPASLATLSLLTMISGIMGAMFLPRVQSRLGKNPINGLLFVIAIAAVIPLYGILGFFNNTLGLLHPWEMYLLAFWYGFALGGLGAGARSIFSLLIPQGKETTFFALYAVTDKGSSMFGPFISAYITDQTHNIRYTFYFLLIMMIAPIAVFWMVDVDRGTKEAHYLENVEG